MNIGQFASEFNHEYQHAKDQAYADGLSDHAFRVTPGLEVEVMFDKQDGICHLLEIKRVRARAGRIVIETKEIDQ